MSRSHRHVAVEQRADVSCVRLRRPQMDEDTIREVAEELCALVTQEGCRKMALSLAPPPECLYSIFLAKLITLQRLLREHGGGLVLCHVDPAVRDIFAACALDGLFRFVSDFDTAVAEWAE